MTRTRTEPPRHGVIVLGAGASRRLGRSKQLLELDGETLLHRAARLALATEPRDGVVVLGADAERLRVTLADLPLRCIVCADFARGLSASLRAGLGALDPQCAGALILLTDQPALDAAHLAALCARWRDDPARAVASGYADTLGVPALLPRSWLSGLLHLGGDRGARDLLRARADEVAIVSAPQLARDVDTPADFRPGEL